MSQTDSIYCECKCHDNSDDVIIGICSPSCYRCEICGKNVLYEYFTKHNEECVKAFMDETIKKKDVKNV